MPEVPDDVLLSLKERLRDWTDYDVAAYFLGKALGVFDPATSFSEVKGLFYAGADTDGVRLLDGLMFLANQGFLETRDFEFRWRMRSEPGP
jgi:hypothetical protein